jgi:AraC-like DNA-binding protein
VGADWRCSHLTCILIQAGEQKNNLPTERPAIFNATFNFIEVLMLLGACQGLLLAVGLVGRRSRAADFLLAGVLLIPAYQLFVFAFMMSGNIIPHLLALAETGFPISFLIGPLYYLYVRSLLEGRLRFRLYDLLHIGPCLYMIHRMLPFFMQPTSVKIGYIRSVYQANALGELSPQVLFNVWFNLILMAVYFFLAYWSISRHEREVRRSSSNTGAVEYLADLRRLTIGYGIYVLGFGVTATFLSVFKTYGIVVDAIWNLAKSGFIYVIGYQALTRNFPLVQTGSGHENGLSESEKYRRSGLSDEQARHYFARLCELMETRQVYTDSELGLSNLAEQLSITPNQLSQIINQEADKSIYEFVNEYRIDYAKHLLKEHTDKTVLDIALKAGFSNKATFNRVFKQHTRTTPTSFKQSEV